MKYFLLAWRDYLTWPLCQWCFIRFLWADDIGWFRIYPHKEEPNRDKSYLVCKHCMCGHPGKLHRLRYGEGER